MHGVMYYKVALMILVFVDKGLFLLSLVAVTCVGGVSVKNSLRNPLKMLFIAGIRVNNILLLDTGHKGAQTLHLINQRM
jgi:hypothetical protein